MAQDSLKLLPQVGVSSSLDAHLDGFLQEHTLCFLVDNGDRARSVVSIQHQLYALNENEERIGQGN